MPNWNMNTIICKPNLVKNIINGDGEVDFNILIPEPKTKEECIAEYGNKYIDNGDKHLDHRDGKDWFDWYNWHCHFWGTKWNACDTYTQDEWGYKYINFSTAWGPPDMWVQKLASLGQPFIFYQENEEDSGNYEGFNGKTSMEWAWNRNWEVAPEDDKNFDNSFPDKEELDEFFGE